MLKAGYIEMDGSWIRRIWYRKDPLAWLLWVLLLPFEVLYSTAVRLVGFLYFSGLIRKQSLPRPVISIGNLTVGGTGKTPTTLWVAGELSRLGYRVGILSRGYKKRDQGIKILGLSRDGSRAEDADPGDAGDEPAMMAKIYGRTVGVGRDRCEVGKRLLLDADIDVFILDDGFQHRLLKRDADLVLLGTDWDGWLIPAGPFREPRSALRRAQLCLITGAEAQWKSFLGHYPEEKLFFGTLTAKGLFTFEDKQWKEHPLGLLDRRKIVAVSAISSSESFYRMIHDWEGDIVQTLEFPDHHNYSNRDWQRINRAARYAELIVTTEKDILKLVRFPFPREKLFALRVEMVVQKGSSLIEALHEVIKTRRSELVKLQES
jgi:tetraacyldisaccharide 4'-kinase